VTEIAEHCGLSEWTHASTVVAAVAATPRGPFRRARIALPWESHNPYYAYDAREQLHLLFHIGPADRTGPAPFPCANGTTPPGTPPAPPATALHGAVHAARDLAGPFEAVPVSFPPHVTADNPAPSPAQRGILM